MNGHGAEGWWNGKGSSVNLCSYRRGSQRRDVAGDAADAERLVVLPKGVSEQQAADLLWAVNDGHLYSLLVTQRGWTTDEYAQWLCGTLAATLLRPG